MQLKHVLSRRLCAAGGSQRAAGGLTDFGRGPRCTHPYISVTEASPSAGGQIHKDIRIKSEMLELSDSDRMLWTITCLPVL